MRVRIGPVAVVGILVLGTAAASPPGSRITADDIALSIPGLSAETLVPVDPSFDYQSCNQFPRPMDLRCDLFSQQGFDAEGRQYAVRYTDSAENGFLPRTEIWRTTASGGSELVASLDPRVAPEGTLDDGRMERITVDPVNGRIYLLLTTACVAADLAEAGCPYQGRANEVVRVSGLKTLADVLGVGAAVPQGCVGAGGGSANPPAQRLDVSGPAADDTVSRPPSAGETRW